MRKDNNARGKRYKVIGLDHLKANYPSQSDAKPPLPFDYLTNNNTLFLIKSKRIREVKGKYMIDFYPEEIKAIRTYEQIYFIQILLIIIKSNRTRKQSYLGIDDFKNPYREKTLTGHSRITIKKEARFY